MRLSALGLAALLAAAPVFVAASNAPEGPWTQGHDHRDPSLHAAAWRMEETDWEPLGGTPATMAGAHALQVRNGLLHVAAWGDQAGAGGLWLLDVSRDGHDPDVVGRVVLPGPVGGDRALDVTADGAFAVVGTEALPSTIYWGGAVNPNPPGILLVDVRIPVAPVVVGYAPTEAGVHSVTVHRIGGVDHVFVMNVIPIVAASVFRIEREPVARLVPVDVQGTNAPFYVGHDSTPYDDPDGRVLLATADGGHFSVWDVSDPARPTRLMTRGSADEHGGHYAHSALLAHLEGRRVLFASTEDWSRAPSTLFVVDVTDFDAPVLLGAWHPPVDAGPAFLRFSLHNPRLHDGTLWFAHYHAGVIGLDVGTLAKAAAPEVVAYAVSSRDTGYRAPMDHALRLDGDEFAYPFVLDVAVDPASGALYAADMFMGVTTYRVGVP